MFPTTFLGKMVVASFLIKFTTSSVVYFGFPFSSGTVNAVAIIPPIEVPTIQSNNSLIGFPAYFESLSNILAGISPLTPPPFIASTL